jgi:murein DD-endopeptidase MepM/ murein hydrolase activator NlpD
MISMRGIAMIGIAAALSLGVSGTAGVHPVRAAETPKAAVNLEQVYMERMQWYEKAGMVTGIPWYELAAVDQYERTMAKVRKLPPPKGVLAIHMSEAAWAGVLNPNPADTNPGTIALYQGIGKDGDGDGAADRTNDADLMAAFATLMLKYGPGEDDRRRALWDYYQNDRAVKRIGQFAKLYRTFGRLDLHGQAFVLPLGANYSYRSTWGANRGWGGARIHEGTDLFASYGVPVRSVCYGIVETKGWNPYGGWRIGIRDLNNVYYYFAHLSGYTKGLKSGDIVTPGQVLGWVGSSGYGRPGTSGKFPPHLHFGLYRDGGLSDWSFDPYPYLRKWEREERQRSRAKNG